jgi:hypothetical protein
MHPQLAAGERLSLIPSINAEARAINCRSICSCVSGLVTSRAQRGGHCRVSALAGPDEHDRHDDGRRNDNPSPHAQRSRFAKFNQLAADFACFVAESSSTDGDLT